MRKSILTALAALALPLICGSALAQDGFTRITSEQDFRKLVVGKKIWIDDNYFTVRKNGRLSGKFNGERLKGAWAWRDGYWCRTLQSHVKNTDCQVWAVKDKQFMVTRDKGTGKSFVYTIK